MSKKTPDYPIPVHSLESAAEAIGRYLKRITLDTYDYRTLSWFFPELGLPNQNYYIGGGDAPTSLPTRNRRFIELQVVSFGTGAGSSVRATLFAGGGTGTDQIFQVTTVGAGWQQALANVSQPGDLLNPGKEALDRTIPWGILLENVGGFSASTNVTVECLYEDFIDYFPRGVPRS